MPRQRQTTEATTIVELAPEVRARLEALLYNYQQLAAEFDILEEQLDIEVAAMKAIYDENGIKKAVIDGTPVSIVTGMSSSLDKLKFVELGGSLEQLNNATVKKPKRPYLRIGNPKPGEDE